MESSTASHLIPHGPATTNQNPVTQQIHHKAQANTTNKLRQELLALSQGKYKLILL